MRRSGGADRGAGAESSPIAASGAVAGAVTRAGARAGAGAAAVPGRRWRPRRAALACALLLFIAGAAACEEAFDGPPELVPARLDDGGNLIALADGDEVELVRPIQGGHVLFVGALLRNVSSRGSVLGELRRSEAPGTPPGEPGPILVSDERSAAVEPLPGGTPAPSAAPGWKRLEPDPTNLANVPACPNFLDVDAVDNQLFLRVVYRYGGREVAAARKVWLRCAQRDAASQRECRCECLARYTIERCLN